MSRTMMPSRGGARTTARSGFGYGGHGHHNAASTATSLGVRGGGGGGSMDESITRDSIIRSRPASPGPGAGAGYGNGDEDEDDAAAQSSSRRSMRLQPQPQLPPHPLSSTLSSGKSTPQDKKRSAVYPSHSDESSYPYPALASPPPPTSSLVIPSLFRSPSHDGEGDERSPLLSIGIERPSTPQIQQREYLSIPHDYDTDLGIPTFVSTERGGYIRPPTLRSRLRLLWTQLVSNTISTAFLLLIVIWALVSRSLSSILETLSGKGKVRHPRPWDNPDRWKDEKLVRDVKYYARSCGYDIQDQEIVTEDGYKLRVHKVIVPSQRGRTEPGGRGGFPVIIQHGLFQSSGSFVTSEERSLAFWLAEKGGYQVYLGNNRAVFDMGHTSLSRSDPRFWDYNIRELALYDLPALVDHVKKETGHDKVAFIGHSQGNATMFVSLARGMVPSLGESLSIFIALAPAVYSGPLTQGFPFTVIKHMDWKRWKRIFGVLDFIPVMRWSYDWTPSLPFALLGYQMFAFLFQWTDANWLLRRKAKMFRFTPSPVPSAGIFWWTGLDGFSSRGCVLNEQVERWYDERFPPLALYHGGKDYLVLCDRLLERLKTHEPDVQVVRVHKLEEGEHCDNFWDVDAVENSFEDILVDIERTRPRRPGDADGPPSLAVQSQL